MVENWEYKFYMYGCIEYTHVYISTYFLDIQLKLHRYVGK